MQPPSISPENSTSSVVGELVRRVLSSPLSAATPSLCAQPERSAIKSTTQPTPHALRVNTNSIQTADSGV